MDEKTPHLHLVFVPLTKDNRLCAKEIIGNRANLTKWQDDFHAYMVEKYPDLERGESCLLYTSAIIVLCPRYFSKRWKHREDTANGR